MTPRRDVPVSASIALRPLLSGPVRAARLLGATPAAAYVEVRGGAGATAVVVALVAPGGVRLPNALVVRGGPGPVATDEVVRAGAGRLVVGARVFVPQRWWDPRPRLPSVAAAALEQRLEVLAGCLPAWHEGGAPFAPALRRAAADLDAALEAEEPEAVAAATEALIGLGPGLTPSGDDVVAGALAALRLLGPAVGARPAARLADAVTAAASAAADRTTSLSAALLAHAGAGEVAAPAGALLRALAGHGAVEHVVPGLLAVGHTSGGDLARGLLIGARATLAAAGARATLAAAGARAVAP